MLTGKQPYVDEQQIFRVPNIRKSITASMLAVHALRKSRVTRHLINMPRIYSRGTAQMSSGTYNDNFHLLRNQNA